MPVEPFSNSMQYADWTDRNCTRCTKEETCDIADALAFACLDDGTVPDEIGKRMGFTDKQARYIWPCAEVEWTEEWKAEYRARHGDER